MKILIVSHKMDVGGTSKALLSLLYELDKYPYDIKLLLLEPGGILESELPSSIKVQYFPGFGTIFTTIKDPMHRTFFKSLKKGKIVNSLGIIKTFLKVKFTRQWFQIYKFTLNKYHNPEQFDLAIAFPGPTDLITYLIATKIKAKKKIEWIHFDVEKLLGDFSFGKKYYKHFDKIFCVSENAKKIFIRHFPEFTPKTETFYNIISENYIKSLAEHGATFSSDFNGIKLLTVGRISNEKGQYMIPEIVDLLKNKIPDFKWYLIGDGSDRKLIENEVKKRGIRDKIVFLGTVENPYAYMRDCDIYIQPSLHEGYGITVHEAKIFNKPCVITDFASASNLIKHQYTGLISAINPSDIAKAIITLANNPELRVTFRQHLNYEDKDTSKEVLKLVKFIENIN